MFKIDMYFIQYKQPLKHPFFILNVTTIKQYPKLMYQTFQQRNIGQQI